MQRLLKKHHIIGTVFIIAFGTLLHFVYEWSNNNSIVGIFGAINESTWEHLKLLFWPAFIYSIVEYKVIGRKFQNYVTARVMSFYVGIFLIISLFYTYTGVIGKHYLVADISIFIISAIISQIISYKFTIRTSKVSDVLNFLSIVALSLLILAFVLFTFNPPHIPLFMDPSSGKYGL